MYKKSVVEIEQSMPSWKFKENKQKKKTTVNEFYNEMSSYLLSEWLTDVSLWHPWLAQLAEERALVHTKTGVLWIRR